MKCGRRTLFGARMTTVYKYFRFENTGSVSVTVRGSAKGRMLVKTSPDKMALAAIDISPSKEWKTCTAALNICDGESSLCFTFEDRGKLDFLEFSLN